MYHIVVGILKNLKNYLFLQYLFTKGKIDPVEPLQSLASLIARKYRSRPTRFLKQGIK